MPGIAGAVTCWCRLLGLRRWLGTSRSSLCIGVTAELSTHIAGSPLPPMSSKLIGLVSTSQHAANAESHSALCQSICAVALEELSSQSSDGDRAEQLDILIASYVALSAYMRVEGMHLLVLRVHKHLTGC